MLSANITLNDAAAAAKTFNLFLQQGQESQRVDTASPDSSQRIMRIQHQVVGPKGAQSRRHNVSFSKSYVDANGLLQTAICGFTVQSPLDATAAAYVDDLVAFVKNFLATGANIDAMRRGES